MYHNRLTGISVWERGTVRGHLVYSNPVGILGQSTDLSAQIVNNLVYANTDQGTLISKTCGIHGSGQVDLVNNTIYQPSGDAVRVEKSPNVRLRNNILWAESGYNLYVAADSQSGFASDYIDLVTTGIGKLASWQGRDFTSLVDWWYEVGVDEHSRAVDPRLMDRDGSDDILGFSREPLEGTARMVDDGDPEFSLVGSWTAKSSGYQGDSYETVGVMGSGSNKATWTLDVTPGAWYEVAVTWPQRSSLTYRAPFVVHDGNVRIDSVDVSQQVAPADFVDAGVGWKRSGYYYVRSDQLTIQLSDKQNPGGPVVADAVRVQRIAGDHGGDDDFRVPAGSPTVDVGHPADACLAEPYPHGNRVNLGPTGNTPQAAGSPAQLVQMLTPNGREKYEVGQPVTLRWRSAGLTLTEIAALINSGGGAVDLWSAHGYQTAAYKNGSFTNTVDTSGVAEPAPASVYQAYAYAANGAGNRIAWQLPVRDGSHQLRRHFAEPTLSSANLRKFDVLLQGSVVQADYDIYAAAGARYKAAVLSLPVTATAGSGFTLELVNKTVYPALLSGIEWTASNPLGDPAPTVDLELSVDGGYTYSPLATGLPLDRYGRGSYVWTAGPETSDNTAVIRVTANQGSQPRDTSDELFLIANDGPGYYVNDPSLEGNLFTTAEGDSTASGKRPDQPMASLAALLATYDLTISGCEVYANASTGIYLDAAPRARAVGNEVRDNAVTGIYAAGAALAAADRIVVQANHVYRHLDSGDRGILIGSGAVALDNVVHDNRTGIEITDAGAAEGNRVYYNTGTGIAMARNGTARGNTSYSNSVGIWAQGPNLAGQILHNLVYANTNQGIRLTGAYYDSGASVVNNTVYQPVGDAVRVESLPGVQLRNNVLGVEAGYAIYVDANSQSGFSSDYNQLHATGTGQLASWQGRDFATLADWGNETGQDQHSRIADPLWVDRDGAEDRLGFRHTLLDGTLRIVDDGDPGFSVTGGWMAATSGYQGDSQGVSGSAADAVATWTMSGLATDAWYEVAITWPNRSSLTAYASYTLLDGSTAIAGMNINQRTAPADFTDAGVGWKRLGYYYLQSGQLTLRLSSPNVLFDFVVADAVRVQRIAGDHGLDDDFRVSGASPTIDAGHPGDDYLAEPQPNGGRLNLGHTGNTAEAAASPAESLQLLTPNGGEKFELGQLVPISWHTSGVMPADGSGDPIPTADLELSTTGLAADRSALVEGNRAYDNSVAGISLGGTVTAQANWVYSNAVGISGQGSWLNAKIENNLIYANANRGIYISGATSANGTRIVNNTVYQPVGDAVRVEGSENVFLRNNILWVEAGYGLYVTSNSQSGFNSDYNLVHQGVDPNAHAGYWNSAVRDSLADWQAASSQDAHSLNGDPLFGDRDGADNVLGYTTAGGGYDGGRDDNFCPAAFSSAIDRASSWDAPMTDLLRNPRVDDPGTPNAGSTEYFEGPASPLAFPPSPSSTAMNWRWDDNSWNLTLPFGFPLFGQTYSLAFVSSNALIQFGNTSSVSDPANSTDKLDDYVRIAPLWDDLRTDGTGDGIFVDTSVAGRVIIRWDATNKADDSDVNVAEVLFSDGRIQFEYGAGNQNLTPTIGLSQGGGKPVRLSLYDGATDLENAAPRAFVLAPGYVDLGAFELLGSSVDVTGPRVINVLPAGIATGGDVPAFAGPLVVAFSEELNPIDARAPANYELRRAVNEVFGDADDVVYPLDPDYVFTPDTGADGSGVLSAADAFLIAQEGLGLSEPFVPDNPRITLSHIGGGVDPQFRIGDGIPAELGGAVAVPVMFEIDPAATNVGAIDFDLFLDASVLTIKVASGVLRGADTAPWAITAQLVEAGHLRVGMVGAAGQPLTPGLQEIARLEFEVEAHVDASLRDANPGLGETGLRANPGLGETGLRECAGHRAGGCAGRRWVFGDSNRWTLDNAAMISRVLRHRRSGPPYARRFQPPGTGSRCAVIMVHWVFRSFPPAIGTPFAVLAGKDLVDGAYSMNKWMWNLSLRSPDGRAAIFAACLVFCGAVAPEVRGADIVILAREHSARSENVMPADASYSGLVVCYGSGGMQQWEARVSEAGPYYIHVYYTAAESRPVTLTVNEKRQDGSFLAQVTGGWTGEHLAWETLGPLDLKQGRNVLRINASGYMPHLAGLVITSSAKQWDRKAFDEQFPSLARRIQDEQRVTAPTRNRLRDMLGTVEIVFIKRFTYTANHYYTEYLNSQWKPGGGIFILSLKDGAVRQVAGELEGGVFGRFDVSFDARKIVFDWKRSNDEGYRIYEVGVDGAGLRQILAAPDNEAELVARYRLDYHNGTDDMHPCYLPDGGIAFVSTRCQTSTLCHGGDAFTTTVLYRMDADGRNLRQLSFGALSEFTPTVLSDGRIMYARWEYVDKGTVVAKCIWAMRPDGTDSSEIYGNDIAFPTTMIQARPIPGAPNHYVFLGCPHYPQNALGTIVRIDMNKPIRSEEPITYLTPEVKILAEGGWHVLDPASGGMVHEGGQGPLYRDPWPIDVNRCLVAHKPRGFGGCFAPNGYGLYLLEGPGEATPFYRDPEISCWQPMPLRPRVRPPVLPSACDPELAERNLARCVVTDVYHGLEGVQRGSIRYLRVLEQVARPWQARRFGRLNADEYDQQHAVVSKDTALGLKVQHGVVPVEEDGSAHFLAPANANIFLQVLDENYLAVQTERTFVNYMPGETRSCVGCHETPDEASGAAVGTPLALMRPPSLPGPQIGETTGRRPLHYPADVQPVLDRHCVECHHEQKQEGGLDLTGRLTKFFSASYENLIAERRGGRQDRRDPDLVPTIGENHPKTGNVQYLPAKILGSHNSLLIAMLAPDKVKLTGDQARLDRLGKLVETHKEVRLTREELLKISNWVDTNAQYYGSYYGRRNLAEKDHPGFRPVPTWESAIGIGAE